MYLRSLIMIILLLVSQVVSQQMFLQTPSNTSVRSGATFTLHCLVHNLLGQCYWKKDGVHVGPEPGKYDWLSGGGGRGGVGDCSLRVSDASPVYDEGEWQCQVSAGNIALRDSLVSTSITVTIISPPTSVNIIINSDQEMECVTESHPASRLQLLVDDEMIGDDEQVDVRTEAGGWRSSLSLSRLLTRSNHNKTVKCVSSHPQSNTILATSTILKIAHAPEILRVSSDHQFYSAGDTAVLQCQVTGHPAPAVTWRHAVTKNIVSDNRELIIEDLDNDSDGPYECIAENSEGKTVSEEVKVNIISAPVIQEPEIKEHFIIRGESFSLDCSTRSTPEAAVRWFHKSLSGDISVITVDDDDDDDSLIIENIDYSDAGEYLCEASNIAGTTLGHVVTLTVAGAPAITRVISSNMTAVVGESLHIVLETCAVPEPEIVISRNDVNLNTSFVLEKKNGGCYEATASLEMVDTALSGEYSVTVVNNLGSESVSAELHVLNHAMLPWETVTGISAGILLITSLILSSVIIIVRRCNRRRDVSVESSGTNTSDISEHITVAGSKEELIRKEFMNNPAQPVLYSELSFPVSSNCGSMRIKKGDHYTDLMSVYNSTIKHNLRISEASSSRNVVIKYV